MRKIRLLDASRMTCESDGATAGRVANYFGDMGPFGYQPVRSILLVLLKRQLSYELATAGLEKMSFDIARKSNLEVAQKLWECRRFNSATMYPIDEVIFPVDKEFQLSLKPEAVAVIDGVPCLIFLQPSKNPVPWAINERFAKAVLVRRYIPDYFDTANFILLDLQAVNGKRQCRVVDLANVPDMSDHEFARRILGLREAWRLHLRSPQPPKLKKKKYDDRQTDFGFEL